MTTKLKTRPPFHLPVEITEERVAPAARINPEFTPAPAKGIYNTQHQSLTLGEKIGTGGEGTVYEIEGKPDFVAKLYHEPPSAEKATKIVALTARGTDRLSKMSAWPVDVLRDTPGGHVIGFVMRRIQQAEEVHTLHSPKSRLKKFPEASWAFLIHVATNIARAIAVMHEAGFVIGDVNPKNILVTRQATVYLLDCDSFQFVDGDKTYRCEGGFPEYTPPELQGIPFSNINRTQEHDCFGLAVVIFQLLFLGRHPYSGRYLGAGEMTLEQAIREGRFAYGADAAARQMQPPPGTLPLAALPDPMAALLRRAFLERDRPNPHEWIAPLEAFSQSLQRCKVHNGHFYAPALTSCPWCELEGRAGIRLFNFHLKPGRANGPFQLLEILTEVGELEQVRPFPAASSAPAVVLSADATRYAQKRDVRFWTAIGLATALGGLIGWFTTLPLAFWFLVGAGFLLRSFVKGSPEVSLWRSLFHVGTQAPVPSLADKIKERRREAQNQLRRFEYQVWGDQEGQKGYLNRIKEIRGRLREYQNFAERRAERLQTALENLQKKALSKHLRKYTFDDPRLAKLTPEMKDWLRERGIATAAGLTSHRFRPAGSTSQFQLLLNWRQQLIDEFQPAAPRSLPPETRVRVEQELETWKMRLETEISHALASLRVIKPRLEQQRSQLLQPYVQTQRDIAQAEADLTALARQNRALPVVLALIIAFLLATALTPSPIVTDSAAWSQYPPNGQRMPGTIQQAGKLANDHINEGLQHVSAGRYQAAKDAFQSALPFVDITRWEDRYASFYHNYCYTKAKLNEGRVYTEFLERQLAQDAFRSDYRLQLVMMYAIEGRWAQAHEEYQVLKQREPTIAASIRTEMQQHGVELESFMP